MNDEIKEILNYLKIENGHCSSELSYEETHLLLDYITNLQHTEDLYNQLLKDYDELQQENERLKELVNPKTQIFIDTQDMEERYGEELYKEYLEKQVKDYKSRCEKAAEYLKSKEDSLFMTFSDDILDHDELIDKKIGTTLLNILNGKE